MKNGIVLTKVEFSVRDLDFQKSMNDGLVSLSRTDQESAYIPYKQVMLDLPHLSGEFSFE